MHNRNNGNKGFTLIELLVVIAIIGILSAIVMASVHAAYIRKCLVENSKSHCRDEFNASDEEIDQIAAGLNLSTKKTAPSRREPCN